MKDWKINPIVAGEVAFICVGVMWILLSIAYDKGYGAGWDTRKCGPAQPVAPEHPDRLAADDYYFLVPKPLPINQINESQTCLEWKNVTQWGVYQIMPQQDKSKSGGGYTVYYIDGTKEYYSTYDQGEHRFEIRYWNQTVCAKAVDVKQLN